MTDQVYPNFTELKLRREGAALWITLDNPPMNSVNAAIHEELARIWRVISADAEVRVVVLTGAGERAFSAGADINGLLRQSSDHELWRRTMYEQRDIVLGVLECEKPVIARVNGHAMGVGALLAVLADVSLVSEKALIADSHVKVGLAAGDGCSIVFREMLGLTRAKKYQLTGDSMTAAEAEAMGLITASMPADQLDQATADWVKKFSDAAPMALQGTKRLLNAKIRKDLQVELDAHLGIQTYTFASSDYKEALTAFVEKRPPVFTGR